MHFYNVTHIYIAFGSQYHYDVYVYRCWMCLAISFNQLLCDCYVFIIFFFYFFYVVLDFFLILVGSKFSKSFDAILVCGINVAFYMKER